MPRQEECMCVHVHVIGSREVGETTSLQGAKLLSRVINLHIQIFQGTFQHDPLYQDSSKFTCETV